MTSEAFIVAQAFAADQHIQGIQPLGNGLINDTFLVTTSAKPFVLQRINRHVFPHPEHITANLRLLEQHLLRKPTAAVRLRLPRLLASSDSTTRDQSCWRALELIVHSESREHITRDREAEQVGAALGHFHALFSDLNSQDLHDTLPGFHITPQYYQSYIQIIQEPLQVADDDEYRTCQAFIAEHQQRINCLEHARQAGVLRERIIHGDPKLNNFLFQRNSDDIISLIDLDTVKPGLIHYDIGDCLRSCCHISNHNRFDSDRAHIILRHYLNASAEFITAADYDYLFAAIWLIPFELGLRFFSDYLQGNRYFKIEDERHNLRRALAQIELCADIDRQRPQLETILANLRNETGVATTQTPVC